ncbi:hypothetical protein NDU88_004253 [Pleurodeles waltl]|uniref:Uncharacterized protein n=1 Tax=Pleurodeles waltl TaxID=8319 RepID=A0AAV7PC87_PLEWA|nr:hypothetical protein NDU88_004253 [Pleurodeles waltl]
MGSGSSGTPRSGAVPAALPGIGSEVTSGGGPSRDPERPANPGARAHTGENGDAVPATSAPEAKQAEPQIKKLQENLQAAPSGHTPSPADPSPLEATDRILQEITSVGRHLEVMDLKIRDLTVASSSIRADIAGFWETVNNLDQRLAAVEDQVPVIPDQEEELRTL